MSKEKKPTYRSQFDGHKRLAAAVILQAIKDAEASSSTKDRETANAFLKSNMWPYSDVPDLPTTFLFALNARQSLAFLGIS